MTSPLSMLAERSQHLLDVMFADFSGFKNNYMVDEYWMTWENVVRFDPCSAVRMDPACFCCTILTSFVSSQPTCPRFCFLFASKFTNISFGLFLSIWCSVKVFFCFYYYRLVGENWWWVYLSWSDYFPLTFLCRGLQTEFSSHLV